MQSYHPHTTAFSPLNIPPPLGGIGADLNGRLIELYRNGNDTQAAKELAIARDRLIDAFELTPHALRIFGELPQNPAIAPGLERELVRFLGAVRGSEALGELCAHFHLHTYDPNRLNDVEATPVSPLAVTSEYLRAFSNYRSEAACISGMLSHYLILLTHRLGRAEENVHPEQHRLVTETLQALTAVGVTETGHAVLSGLSMDSTHSRYEDLIRETLWTADRVEFVGSTAFQSAYRRPSTRVFSVYEEGLATSELAYHAEIVTDIRQAVPVCTAIAKSLPMVESGIIAVEILAALKARRIGATSSANSPS